ncbi:hypothetical protein SEUCBS139899_008865 [Sporothrix eucalyptigena]|uniref:Pentatricopeptide repeat protein n=1 Tax=Sporothrix eucalyptigena TaxID=1812306 RepID=A0ABP0ARV7_9PEZI
MKNAGPSAKAATKTAANRTTRRVHNLVAGKKEETRSTAQYVLAQQRRIQRTSRGRDVGVAIRAFRFWKKSVKGTQDLLENGRLPREAKDDHLLWQILGPRESQEDGEVGSDERIQRAKKAWLALPEEQRSKEWPELMTQALWSGPRLAYVFFLVTFDTTTMPLYLAEDTIHFLAQVCFTATTANSGGQSSPSSDGLDLTGEDIFALLRHVLDAQPPIKEEKDLKKAARVLLQQATIFYITRSLSTTEGVWDLYKLLRLHGHALYKDTRLQIARQLARSPRPTFRMRALEVLQEALATTKLDINSPQSASVCTAILTVHEGDNGKEAKTEDDEAEPEPVATPAEMFEALLRCGLEPNLIMYTTLIRGLCLRHELNAAQQVLELMVKNQIDPDDTVYSIMMNGAKTCGDVPALQRVADSAAAHDVRHPYVWNDFLQAIYQTAQSEVLHQPSGTMSKHVRIVPAFPLMVQAFSRMFVRTPLETLLPNVFLGGSGSDISSPPGSSQRWEFVAQLEPTIYNLPQLPRTTMIEPTSPTLATMILGYIQSLSRPYDVISFYSHFRRLLQAGDPTAVRLVQSEGTRIHDIVIMALCKHEGMLRATLDVVGDMLRDATASMEGTGTEAPPGHSHPPPSIYTWSILLNGFMVHRQARQGERILKMMRDRDVEPNIVTWNSLLAGYARAQKAQEAARAVLRLERAGFEPDEHTIRAFSYLIKKASALRFLEDHRAAKKAATVDASSVDAAEIIKVAGTPAGSPVAPSDAENNSLWGTKPVTVAELHDLENEVEEIAKMMDEEQRDGSSGSTV